MIAAYQYRFAAPLLDRYNIHLLRKSFARIRVAGLEHLRASGPIVAAPNHSCWWDGCVDLYLSRSVLRRPSLLMMGETELAKHKVFSSLGVFSGDARYAVRQLHGERVLWLYPQGEMLPARAPLTIHDGAAFIARHANAALVPVAQRFEFLRDDHPDVLVRIGAPTSSLLDDMTSLLARVDDDVAHSRFDDYETVLHGAESRNTKLERLRR